MSTRNRSTSARPASLKGVLAALAIATVGTLVAVAAAAAQTGEGQVSLPIGTQAPDAALQDLDETDFTLLSFADGKPTLIEFWASWCEQCEALQPQIDEIVASHGESVNVVAVAVAVSQSLRRVRRHVEDAGHAYPFLWDAKGEAVRAYEAATTSVVVILDAEGRVAYTGVGSDQDLVGVVTSMVGGR